MKYVLYFYISTFRTIVKVQVMYVQCPIWLFVFLLQYFPYYCKSTSNVCAVSKMAVCTFTLVLSVLL